LATFEYLVVFPEILADEDGPLYPGSEESQSERFSAMLAVVLKKHETEINEMGYDISEIGVHSSIRKGATTYISSGTTAAPSSMSVNLRGGWSMGSAVRDVYMLYEKAGDQYIGRLTAGLPVLSEQFAVSNPAFIPVQERMLKACSCPCRKHQKTNQSCNISPIKRLEKLDVDYFKTRQAESS
jgi:hypothetical protein